MATRGRPKGSRNKKTKDFAERYDALQRKYKFDPAEFLFICAANQLPPDLDEDGNEVAINLPLEFRAQCAKDLLPYRFSKSTAVEADTGDGTPIQFGWIIDDASGQFLLPTESEPDSATQQAATIQG